MVFRPPPPPSPHKLNNSSSDKCLAVKGEFALLAGGEITWLALTAAVFIRAILTVCGAIAHAQPGDAGAIAAPELQLFVAQAERITCSTRKHKHHAQNVYWLVIGP